MGVFRGDPPMPAETDILIRTKLHRPQITANLVARPWLLEWLSQHRRRPLTLVSASAGYGKTTLISSWLETIDSPSAWLSLDEYDDDLIVFLTYFIAAIQTIFPETGRQTQDLLNASTLPPVPVLTRSLSGELAQLTTPFILVLDDYHMIREAAIHDLLSQLLRHPSRAMHLVIITRGDPPLPIVKLRARGQMTEIRHQELRFKAAETTTFLQQMSVQADDIATASLTEKTEGWVTGLRLAALSLRHRGDISLLLKRMPENIRYVTDYLLAEVLNQLAPATQDFLLKTSILDRMCGPLSDHVTELDEPECHGQAYLTWMLEQNLFITPLDAEHYWYR
jgi:LuxR family maltose regulon positive regulatory protein